MRRLILAGLGLCLTSAPLGVLAVRGAETQAGSEPAVSPHAAASASGFLASLGVNTHLSWPGTPYADLDRVERELSYLGLSNIRDDAIATPQTLGALDALAGRGVRLDLLAHPDLAGALRLATALEAAHPGAVRALEGLNEVDGWSPRYAGLTGYAAAIRFQQDLWTRTRADPRLTRVAVYNTTVSAIVGSRRLGDLAAYADDANVHIYYGGGQPAYGWSPQDPTFAWTRWLASAQADAPGRPTVVTETGAAASARNARGRVGVDAPTQAKQILNSLMDAARSGVAATYIYELADSRNNGPADAESRYGLFDWSGAARPAAVAIHNLTRILGAGGPPARGPGALTYALSGTPAQGGQMLFEMLFEQGDGAYDLVVWAEPDIWDEAADRPIAAADTPLRLTLAQAAQVSIYDPMLAAAPVRALGTTRQASFDVTDHPIIVQVRPVVR
jgi:hypothetical protein